MEDLCSYRQDMSFQRKSDRLSVLPLDFIVSCANNSTTCSSETTKLTLTRINKEKEK